MSSKMITYSPAYTLVPTYECFNRCTYCNFRVDPNQDNWLPLADAEATLRSLQSGPHDPVIEILILSGEVHPHSPRRVLWFEHIYNLCELALSLGFLPHTNVGPLSRQEMERLRSVNVSMGLMLEQMAPALMQTVHVHAPSKVPELRLQQLQWAGELKIPFTTGLLLGIGESINDRLETLRAIAQLHQRFGHIQEVILQPYSPGRQEQWGSSACSPTEFVEVVAIAHQILPADIAIQIPPNLVHSPQILLACLEAGARDLGGIGPWDEVNPDYPHPLHTELKTYLTDAGWELGRRLPVYPQYDEWVSPPLKTAIQKWRKTLSKVATN